MPSVSNLAREEEYDYVGEIMAYEDGTIDEDRFIKLFQYLVDTGLAWKLQGHYGRTAQEMLESGKTTYKTMTRKIMPKRGYVYYDSTDDEMIVVLEVYPDVGICRCLVQQQVAGMLPGIHTINIHFLQKSCEFKRTCKSVRINTGDRNEICTSIGE